MTTTLVGLFALGLVAALSSVCRDLSAQRGFLLIEDSGRGFDPESASPVGLGLISMHERVNYLGGRLAVKSTPGAGTRISVSVPVKDSQKDVSKVVAGFA